jgi:FkbM family methyltransferase
MNPPSEDELVWQFLGGPTPGFFVEVGANDPQNHSQTWLLERRGWRGILIEPLLRFQEALRSARPGAQVVRAACGPPGHPPTAELFVGEDTEHSTLRPNTVDAATRYAAAEVVPVLTLDEILEQAGNPRVDFVSIDVEGLQLDVLRGFDLARHRPRLLFVEDHLLSWGTHRHVTARGYRLVKRTRLNNWYVPADAPFALTTRWERVRLWRKVWPGTLWRRLRHELSRFRRTA